MAPHLREGARYAVARFHSALGQTLRRGQRLDLVRIAVHHGDRHLYTEFHFRDVETGGARLWTIDGAQDDGTGRDLFDAAPDDAATPGGAAGPDGAARVDGSADGEGPRTGNAAP